MLRKDNMDGRSMIEMLGVLAIIGVLSVGGIAGYSKAMMQFKINKTVEQITHIVSNLRTLYATQTTYEDVDKKAFWKKGHVFPDEMWNSSGTAVESTFGGSISLTQAHKTIGGDGKAFRLDFRGLPEEACMALVSYDWGTSSSSGLIAVGSGNMSDVLKDCEGKDTSNEVYACPGGDTVAVPMKVSVATKACSSGVDNTITWLFY